MFGRRLAAADGTEVEVIDPGRHNMDSGPDFFNSKIRIGGEQWAGNVEIHVKASDWYRHGHDSDPAYDGVILHVVGVSDKRVRRADGSLIPQVEITMPEDFFRTYAMLSSEMADIRCASRLHTVPALAVTDWLESLSIERVQKKSERVLDICKNCGGDWEQTCFIMLARGLGFGLNGEPFEMLARSVPLRVLHHHSDNPLQLQAIFFGQAGMLDSSLHIFDEYYQLLCREYYFRPQNFPHRRIAFLSKSCEDGFSMFSKILDSRGSEEDMRKIFGWRLEGYWHTHSSFDVDARAVADTLSQSSVTLLIVNVVVPLLYACAMTRGDADIAEKAIDILSSLPAEVNTITRRWAQLGLEAGSAFRSQALIHLQREYCEARKCLYCRFGHRLLRYSSLP